MTDPDKKKSKSPFWPVNWVRNESFWKEIAQTVVGTGTVALIVFVYASLAGYLDPGDNNAGQRLTYVLVAIFVALCAVILGFLTVGSAVEMQRREGRPAYWRYLFGLGFLSAVMIGLVLVPLIFAIVNDAPA